MYMFFLYCMVSMVGRIMFCFKGAYFLNPRTSEYIMLHRRGQRRINVADEIKVVFQLTPK